eukprot:3358421-Rhodomonas_salina.8
MCSRRRSSQLLAHVRIASPTRRASILRPTRSELVLSRLSLAAVPAHLGAAYTSQYRTQRSRIGRELPREVLGEFGVHERRDCLVSAYGYVSTGCCTPWA